MRLALDATDVIVYVATTSRECRARPKTTLLAAAQGSRYLSITLPVTTCSSLSPVERPLGMQEAIGWLGHELHHAVEIGLTPSARNQDSVGQLFRQIGYWHPEFSGYETRAALEVQRAIMRELSKR
jgi:hypothetical protein